MQGHWCSDFQTEVSVNYVVCLCCVFVLCVCVVCCVVCLHCVVSSCCVFVLYLRCVVLHMVKEQESCLNFYLAPETLF